MNRIAIVSPKRNAYSETFIQSHRKIPGFEIKFYYEGNLPRKLEGEGMLVSMKPVQRLRRGIMQIFFKSDRNATRIALEKSLKKNKIKCVLAEYGMTGAALYELCEKLKIPLIVHFHGMDAVADEIIEKYEVRYKAMFQIACKVIAVSHVMEEKLIVLGCPEEKLVYNPYGPNDRFFQIEPTYSDKLLLGLGRFVDKKAPYYTVLAFKEALKPHPDARLVMGGNGPLLNTCINLVNYLGISKNVDFPGVLDHAQFESYLKRSRAFVQHSITARNGDMEGSPVAVMEASAAGLPVISTRHAGIPEVIEDRKTGFVVDEHDVAGMAKAMIEVLNSRRLAREMGQSGKERMKRQFSLQKHLEKHALTINEAIKYYE